MKQTHILMGMPVILEVVDPGVSGKIFETVFDYLGYVDRKFSTYKQDSEISLIDRQELSLEEASDDMKAIFRLAEQTRLESAGYFEIRRDGLYDPSGIVKGWAILGAVEIIREAGFENFSVYAGGDIQVSGKNAEGQDWRVGIQNPFNPREIVKVLSLQDCGIATSGTYARGQHIYNPKQPDRAITDIVSLTVIGLDIFEADRFATAAFAMGSAGINFIEELDGLEGYLIDQHGLATYTSRFEGMCSMLKAIDNLLNRITMYRLVLYYLIFLLGAAALLSGLGILKYDVYALLFSISFLVAVCWGVNWIFARTFGVAANVESVYISALILALIITPIQSFHDLWFLGWAAVLAMSSKYILAISRKHIFNPVALAVALTYFMLNQSASWWVGNAPMLPFVLVGGLLVVRKLGRSDLVWSFLITTSVISLVLTLFAGGDLIGAMQKTLLYSPLFFFAFIILTEPLTTPPTRRSRIGYGLIAGFFFTPQVHFGTFYITPELAILFGNAFSYIVSPKSRLVLRLKEKIRVAPDIYDFIFTHSRRFAFVPGQYMEWTLGHDRPDSRGVRRYFTLASAPTEKTLRLGVKFAQETSTFKKAMLEMNAGDEIVAAQLAGDFVLPRDPRQRIVLIAGGVGVTPFRSMIKYLLDTRQRRPVTLFYANKNIEDIVYKDVFDRAQHELGIQVIYSVTEAEHLPASWTGTTGRITPQLIKSKVPDYRRCIYYISGPKGMVDSFKESLDKMHIRSSQIKTDYFSGLA